MHRIPSSFFAQNCKCPSFSAQNCKFPSFSAQNCKCPSFSALDVNNSWRRHRPITRDLVMTSSPPSWITWSPIMTMLGCSMTTWELCCHYPTFSLFMIKMCKTLNFLAVDIGRCGVNTQHIKGQIAFNTHPQVLLPDFHLHM